MLFKKISRFLIYYLVFFFPVSLAGAPSPHAWWLDPRLKIPIINLHDDKLRKCCVSLPLRVPLSALSFIPHKHMRYGAVLMRTEWTDPRPQCHWGPPPQIHRRYQFSSVLLKRPRCGIQNTSVLCSAIPHKFPQKLLLCLFCADTSQNCWQFSLLHVHYRTVSNAYLWRNGHEIADSAMPCPLIAPWITILIFHLFFSAWCMRAFTRPLTGLTNTQPTTDHIKVKAGNHEMKELWHVEDTWTGMQWKSIEWRFFIFYHWTG